MEKIITEYEEIKALLDSLDINNEEALVNFKNNLAGIKKEYLFQSGKDLNGLLQNLADANSKGVSYWDYIETDALLSLQKPKTYYPDEVIFITYHQNCELYFKLIIQELERLIDLYRGKEDDRKFHFVSEENENPDKLKIWTRSLTRVIRYYYNLIFSFNILKEGLSKEEFKKFRLALQPASGFQTFQFRKIEMMLTPLINLVPPAKQSGTPDAELFNNIYWRTGAIQENKDKTITPSKLLMNFNSKYKREFEELIEEYKGITVLDLYGKLLPEQQVIIKPLLIEIENAIICWKTGHINMIYKHMPKERATGGTDHVNYLPQLKEGEKEFNKHHQVIYFPGFWKDREGKHHEYITDTIKSLPVKFFAEVQSLYENELGKMKITVSPKENTENI